MEPIFNDEKKEEPKKLQERLVDSLTNINENFEEHITLSRGVAKRKLEIEEAISDELKSITAILRIIVILIFLVMLYLVLNKYAVIN